MSKTCSAPAPELAIVVVSYNTCALTLACLRSVFAQTSVTRFELLVIDNASSDGSALAIEREFGSRVKLLRSTTNLGFAAANNRAAQQTDSPLMLMLNPDTVVLDGAIDRLVDFAKRRRDARIWGGRTVFPDGLLNPASCWSRQTIWSLVSQAVGLSSLFRRSTLFNPEGIGGWNRAGERQVDIVSGCFLLVDKRLWERLGGFDPDFFMYGEEADLCLRAARYDARPRVCAEATIIHYGGASEPVKVEKMIRLLRAKMLLIERHFRPSSQRRIGSLLLSTWPLSRWLVCALLARIGPQRFAARSAIWQAIWRRRLEWQTTDRITQSGPPT